MAGRGLKSSHLVAVVHRASRPSDELAQVIHGRFAGPITQTGSASLVSLVKRDAHSPVMTEQVRNAQTAPPLKNPKVRKKTTRALLASFALPRAGW